MNENNNLPRFILLLRSPFVGGALGVILIFLFIFALIMMIIFIVAGSEEENGGDSAVACQMGDLDEESYNAQFTDVGGFNGMGDVFIEAGQANQVDPVLLASIAFAETTKGKSKHVRELNNPGGLYNSKAKEFFHYDTLEEGINAMAKNLYKLYISKGLVTIQAIGAKYAPIGADNDPLNLNANWVPNVTYFAEEFGGLSANCSSIGFSGDGFGLPVNVWNVTSPYGTRVDPISGAVQTHNGIDFACALGDPIYAVMDGTVHFSQFSSSWGNFVALKHGDKYTVYAHLTHQTVLPGETVQQGQQIGKCGTTGRSTGPHLHLELHTTFGTKIDPTPYFTDAKGGES